VVEFDRPEEFDVWPISRESCIYSRLNVLYFKVETLSKSEPRPQPRHLSPQVQALHQGPNAGGSPRGGPQAPGSEPGATGPQGHPRDPRRSGQQRRAGGWYGLRRSPHRVAGFCACLRCRQNQENGSGRQGAADIDGSRHPLQTDQILPQYAPCSPQSEPASHHHGQPSMRRADS